MKFPPPTLPSALAPALLATAPIVRAQTTAALTVLHNFGPAGGNTDGEHPFAGLIQGKNGNFYGVTQQGGTGGNGVVFEMTPTGALNPLHSFSAEDGNHVNTEGAGPNAPLFQISTTPPSTVARTATDVFSNARRTGM